VIATRSSRRIDTTTKISAFAGFTLLRILKKSAVTFGYASESQLQALSFASPMAPFATAFGTSAS